MPSRASVRPRATTARTVKEHVGADVPDPVSSVDPDTTAPIVAAAVATSSTPSSMTPAAMEGEQSEGEQPRNRKCEEALI